MEQFVLFLYSLLLTLTLILVSPLLLIRPKTRAGLKGKLGFIDKGTKEKFAHGIIAKDEQIIWIHAVSVGEFNAAYPFIKALKNKFTDKQIVISTTTKAGQAMAKERAGDIAEVIYFPFDLPWSVNAWLTLVKPNMVIIFETELWPNFIYACWRLNIPVVLLNARMSPRSFNGYQSAKWLFGPLLRKLTLIGAQTVDESRRYQALTGDNLQTVVLGNLKYDWPALMDEKAGEQLKKKLGIETDNLVLIGGSTHAGEEKLLLDLLKRWQSSVGSDSKLKVIIAPRHPERFEYVAKLIEESGCSVRRHSKGEKFVGQLDVYLLDTIGQLANYYALASVAFVGGTIAKVGGHNLLEPYLYTVPVVCGPNLFKTREVANILSNEEALFIGENEQEVENKIIQLLQNNDLRREMGKRGKIWLERNRGAVERSLAIVSELWQKKTVNEIVR